MLLLPLYQEMADVCGLAHQLFQHEKNQWCVFCYMYCASLGQVTKSYMQMAGQQLRGAVLAPRKRTHLKQ